MTEKRPAVLIVDDQPNWRELFSDLLEDEYDVVSVGSYEEALRALDRKPPFRVAVVDIRLEDRDPSNEEGLRLIEQINQRRAGTSTIIVTGYPAIRTIKMAFQDLKVSDYIEKYPEDGTSFDMRAFRRSVSEAAKSSGNLPQDRLGQDVTSVANGQPHQSENLPETGQVSKSIVTAKRWGKPGIVCTT